MKVKGDFVTNSSSASFIMTFSADMNYEEFAEAFGSFLENFAEQSETNIRFWDGSNIKQIAPNIFQIEEWTSMYNYLDDIPKYMQWILIDNGVNGDELSSHNIKMTNFEIQND